MHGRRRRGSRAAAPAVRGRISLGQVAGPAGESAAEDDCRRAGASRGTRSPAGWAGAPCAAGYRGRARTGSCSPNSGSMRSRCGRMPRPALEPTALDAPRLADGLRLERRSLPAARRISPAGALAAAFRGAQSIDRSGVPTALRVLQIIATGPARCRVRRIHLARRRRGRGRRCNTWPGGSLPGAGARRSLIAESAQRGLGDFGYRAAARLSIARGSPGSARYLSARFRRSPLERPPNDSAEIHYNRAALRVNPFRENRS